ncbi:MAG: hypothetical protein QM750_15930 [Rubrivivax sp.]
MASTLSRSTSHSSELGQRLNGSFDKGFDTPALFSRSTALTPRLSSSLAMPSM